MYNQERALKEAAPPKKKYRSGAVQPARGISKGSLNNESNIAASIIEQLSQVPLRLGDHFVDKQDVQLRIWAHCAISEVRYAEFYEGAKDRRVGAKCMNRGCSFTIVASVDNSIQLRTGSIWRISKWLATVPIALVADGH